MQIKSVKALQVEVIAKCLQSVMEVEPDQTQKKKLQSIIEKLEHNQDRKSLLDINPVQSKLLTLLVDGFHAYKQGFFEIIKKKQYAHIAQLNFDIAIYLLDMQKVLKVTYKDSNYGHVILRYTVTFIKMKRQYEVWGQDFHIQWTVKSKDILKKIEDSRIASNKLLLVNEQDLKEDSPLQKTQHQDIKEERKDPVNDIVNSEEKPHEESKLIALKAGLKQNVSKQKIKSIYSNPSNLQSIKEIVHQKPIRQKQKLEAKQKKIEHANCDNKMLQKTKKQGKSYLTKVEAYLNGRSDLVIDTNQHKELLQIISTKLILFLKKATSKIIEISTLKSSENSQLNYFSPQNSKIQQLSPFYISPNEKKITALVYGRKLDIYKSLRQKQFNKQNNLRSIFHLQLMQQIRHSRSKKKCLDIYLEDSRQDKCATIESKDENIPVSQTNALSIRKEHVIFYLEDHRFLRNSLLLFKAYHY